jgi:hypothetical protein
METPILVSLEVYDPLNTLHPQFMSTIEARGLKYVRVMPEHDDPSSAIGRGWRATFNASDTGAPNTVQLPLTQACAAPAAFSSV